MRNPPRVPGPGLPDEVQAILKSFYDAIVELQSPGQPIKVPTIDTAANLLKRTPAASYPRTVIEVQDKNCLALSTNVAGVWTWLRPDGSAL